MLSWSTLNDLFNQSAGLIRDPKAALASIKTLASATGAELGQVGRSMASYFLGGPAVPQVVPWSPAPTVGIQKAAALGMLGAGAVVAGAAVGKIGIQQAIAMSQPQPQRRSYYTRRRTSPFTSVAKEAGKLYRQRATKRRKAESKRAAAGRRAAARTRKAQTTRRSSGARPRRRKMTAKQLQYFGPRRKRR